MADGITVQNGSIYFPPGTPYSVVNSYYNNYQRNQALQAELDYKASQQPEWWETTFNNLSQNVFNPYLRNIINEPFQDYRKSFDTDQAIRQNQAQNESQLAREQALLQFKQDLENQQMAGLGQAYGNLGQTLNTPGPPLNVESYGPSGGVSPYGAYDDPWSTQIYNPEATVKKPPTSKTQIDEMTGNPVEVEHEPIPDTPAPSGQANIFTTIPGKKPSLQEALTLLAANPLDAGRVIESMKRLGMQDIYDPDQVKKNKALADILETSSKTQARNTLLPGQVATQGANLNKIEAQTSLIGSQIGLTDAKSAEAQLHLDTLRNFTPEQLKMWVLHEKDLGNNLPKQVAMYMQLQQETDPEKAAVLRNAINMETARQINISTQRANATVPARVVQTRLPTVMKTLTGLDGMDEQVAQTTEALDRFAQTGLLPASPTAIGEMKAWWRQRVNQKVWDNPQVQEDAATIQRFLNGLLTGYDRGVLGDIGGARIKENYNLPKDPIMLPERQIREILADISKGTNNLRSRLSIEQEMLLQSIGQGGTFSGAPLREWDLPPGAVKVR